MWSMNETDRGSLLFFFFVSPRIMLAVALESRVVVHSVLQDLKERLIVGLCNLASFFNTSLIFWATGSGIRLTLPVIVAISLPEEETSLQTFFE